MACAGCGTSYGSSRTWPVSIGDDPSFAFGEAEPATYPRPRADSLTTALVLALYQLGERHGFVSTGDTFCISSRAPVLAGAVAGNFMPSSACGFPTLRSFELEEQPPALSDNRVIITVDYFTQPRGNALAGVGSLWRQGRALEIACRLVRLDGTWRARECGRYSWIRGISISASVTSIPPPYRVRDSALPPPAAEALFGETAFLTHLPSLASVVLPPWCREMRLSAMSGNSRTLPLLRLQACGSDAWGEMLVAHVGFETDSGFPLPPPFTCGWRPQGGRLCVHRTTRPWGDGWAGLMAFFDSLDLVDTPAQRLLDRPLMGCGGVALVQLEHSSLTSRSWQYTACGRGGAAPVAAYRLLTALVDSALARRN